MNAREFFSVVRRMRRLQKRFEKTRSSLDQMAAQKAEKEVDDEIERVDGVMNEKRKGLFDGQRAG